MKNDLLFWKKYLNKTIKNLEKLLEKNEPIFADFHIHSNYSADSDQSLEQIINRAQELNFDIISITDHDSIKVYDELYNYLKDNNLEKPIIIPGVEFTIDNKEYGSQFHILQLMINPKNEMIVNNILHQEQASWIRVKKQFERLERNQAMRYFFKKFKFNCTIEKYKKYLNNCTRPIPEYKTIMEYLMSETAKFNITNWDILKQMKKWNSTDKSLVRKKIKEEAFERLENRYNGDLQSDYDFRFFHSLLAIRGADDDFFLEYECMGDLSVNDYDELKLDELNKNNMTFFAHPSENKLYLLEKLLAVNNNICGMELNKRCKYSDIKNFNDKLERLNMLKIIGSDSHDIDSNLYDDIKFYEISKTDLNKFIQKARKYIDNIE